MGGHGGLNILPQKKWNVYNHDNRAIVDKDKKLHAEKLKKQEQERRDFEIQGKIDVLKGQRNDVQKDQQPQMHSLLTLQMQRIAESKKHINFFENQQKILANQQLLQAKILKEEEFLKDKNMDFSSRFLGAYNDKSKMPWYSQRKGFQPQKKQQKYKEQSSKKMIYANKTDSQITREIGASMHKHSKFEEEKDYKSSSIKSKDHKYQIYDRYDRNDARERSRDIRKQVTQVTSQDPLEQLRMKRIKREEKQKAKAALLKQRMY